ncbi:MAG: hypothetical protein M3P11_12670 [Actinomycetota bacterium]|nr:hypothetical protein [Actinomycetota bacterium]
MRKQLRRKARTVAGAIALAGVLAVSAGVQTASAATPTVQGCVGSSLSAGATSSDGSTFGQFVSGVAQDTSDRPGVGDAVQALESGQVLDADFQNTCN